MKIKYTIIVVLLGLILIPFSYIKADTSNSGFIPGNIWYSSDPFKDGDNVKIYTMIYNPDQRQFLGTVFFFDKTTFLGSKDFTIEGKGLKDISINWVATPGDHLIFAQIQNAKFLNSDNTYEKIESSDKKTQESKRTVSKKIINNINLNIRENEDTTTNNTIIPSIHNFIKEKTLDIVSTAIDGTTNVLENFRYEMATISTDKKNDVSKEIKEIEKNNILKSDGVKTKEPSVLGPSENKENTLLKPFKYTELFALSLFSNIFNNRYIYYGLIALLLFIILRFIIRKFF